MNVDIELQVDQRKTYHTTFQLLLGSWTTVYKIHRFVQYTPRKVFNSFVQSIVDIRQTGDQNPISGVVAETMNLL